MNDAINQYLKAVKALCPNVTQAELDFLESGLTINKLNSKEFYLRANDVQNEMGYVYSGLLRAFYIDQSGNEITVNFLHENNYATHYSAFITRTPSKYYFQCLEPCVIVQLSYEHMQAGYEKFPMLERYGRLVAEEVLKAQQKRIESFLFDTAETRYLDFIKANPELFNRVSISYLSTYLGIERQTLTRIRKRLAHTSF